MAAWILEDAPKVVLEPSFGDGTFLAALQRVSADLLCAPPRMIGVEIDEQAFARTLAAGVLDPSDAILSDFCQVKPAEVDAVIGNPPYVRLRHLTESAAAAAKAAAAAQLGFDMDPAGSLWMPFVAHAVPFIRSGGRLALVLPVDATYVRYARPLWEYLGENFGELRVVRSRERLFPDLLQDVVLLLCSEKGAKCSSVQYSAYATVDELLVNSAEIEVDISLAEILDGKRPFTWAHVDPALSHLLESTIFRGLQPAKEVVRFRIGYVSGDKEFFDPSKETRSRFCLEGDSLVRAISSGRKLRKAGLYTSRIADESFDRLFLPRNGLLGDAEKQYVEYGKEIGVDQRYKCRVREPWYTVPYVDTPDVVLNVFSECPTLVVNDASIAASNSLLCGYVDKISARQLAARWYTSLTLLHIEAEVHSLGGGVMVLVPREAGNVKLVGGRDVSEAGLASVDERLWRGDVKGAYEAGDEAVLKGSVGMSGQEVDLIRAGIESLARWRTSARGREQA